MNFTWILGEKTGDNSGGNPGVNQLNICNRAIDYLITIEVNVLKYTRVEKINAVEEVIIK